MIGSGVVVAVATVLYWLSTRIGRRFVNRIAARGEDSAARAETLWLVVRRVILVAIVVTAAWVIFDFWGLSLAPFIAVGTVIGVAIGFGAQNTVKDMLAGFFVLAEDQFRVGDTVAIASTTGTVQDIQFRVTVLRDLEGNVHFVPNGQIGVTTNFTSQYAQPVIDIGVSYDDDVDQALAVMKDELDKLASDPEWSDRIKGEAEILGVNELDDSAVILRGRLTTVAGERWSVRREAFRRLKIRFDAEGITIPYPHLTVYRGD